MMENLAPEGQPLPPITIYPAKVIYDFVTDPALVPQMVGYRRSKGFTIVAVNEQPQTEANYVTGFQPSNFPASTYLAIPSAAKSWVIISTA